MTDSAAGIPKVKPRGMTTAALIDLLRKVDPAGERVVFMELVVDGVLVNTDGVRSAATEDAAAVWDHDRVVLSNEGDLDG